MKRYIEVAAAVIRRGDKVLLTTRPESKPPAGLEFPGGKIEPGETLQQAAERELREELGAECMAFDEMFRVLLETPTALLHLRFVRVMLTGEVNPQEGQQAHWFSLRETMPEELLAPDRPLWEFIQIL